MAGRRAIPNPKPGATPERFPTVIQIVPATRQARAPAATTHLHARLTLALKTSVDVDLSRLPELDRLLFHPLLRGFSRAPAA